MQIKAKKSFFDKVYTGKLTTDITSDNDIVLIDSLDFSMIPKLTKAKCIICKKNILEQSHKLLILKDLCIPQMYGVPSSIDKLIGKTITFFSADNQGTIYQGKQNIKIKEKKPKNKYVFVSTERGIKYHANKYSEIIFIRGEFLQLSFLATTPLIMLTKNKRLFIENIRRVLETASDNFNKVIYRLSDFSQEYLHSLDPSIKTPLNPALGQRGASLLIGKHLEVLKAELKAIKKVCDKQNKIEIIIPFVRSIDEVKQIKKITTSILGEDIKLGIMIEVPEMIFRAKELSKLSSFFGIGNKDLSQLLNASDRDDPSLNHNNKDIIIKLLGEYFAPNIDNQTIYIPDSDISKKLINKYNLSKQIICIKE